MNITVLGIDVINGERVSREGNATIKTKAALEEKRKELLSELRADHPDWDEKQKKNGLFVCFLYQEDSLHNPDPRLMPKPLCECGATATANQSGTITCSCGKVRYNELYDLAKYLKKNGTNGRSNKKILKEVDTLAEEESRGSVQGMDKEEGRRTPVYFLRQLQHLGRRALLFCRASFVRGVQREQRTPSMPKVQHVPFGKSHRVPQGTTEKDRGGRTRKVG